MSKRLGRTDHGWMDQHNNWQDEGAPCVGAERDLAAARRCLHMLGAWPYAHASAGRLPDCWWTSSTFTDPLGAWQKRALDDARLYLELSRAAASA